MSDPNFDPNININVDIDTESKDIPQDVITHEHVKCASKKGANYLTIAHNFGCQMFTSDLLDKIRVVTKQSVLHPLLERNIIFAHRDFDKLIDKCIKTGNNNFYLYTGRGPSSDALHLGHLVPFMITQYLQKIFNVPVIIQITDDEKYYRSKNNDQHFTDFQQYAINNIKDIVACGFDPSKTFIFINSSYYSYFSHNLAKINKKVSLHNICSIFGSDKDDNMGQVSFPIHQLVPSFASSFPNLFLDDDTLSKHNFNRHMTPIDLTMYKIIYPHEFESLLHKLRTKSCLIVAAIDQDPYFRLARDIAHKINEHKPILLYSQFLGSLLGKDTKMSASVDNSAIYLTDTEKEIKTKINKYCFSGGKDTIEEHRKHGGDTSVDVAYHYLTFFNNNVDELDKIKSDYESGKLLTGELKKITIQLITNIVKQHQQSKDNISPAYLNQFLTPHHLI